MKYPKPQQELTLDRRFALSPREAAQYSGIGITKIYELAKQPDANFVMHVGRCKTLIRRKDFEEYLEANDQIL